MLEHLGGCIAWKDPAQALQQKERLRQKKEKELAEAAQAAQAAEQQDQGTENEYEQAGAMDESPGLSMSM